METDRALPDSQDRFEAGDLEWFERSAEKGQLTTIEALFMFKLRERVKKQAQEVVEQRREAA